MANIGTARIQVNCSAVKELQRKIEVEGEEGVSIQIDVHYENVPLRCKECQVFGHSDAQCLRQRGGARSRSRSRGPGVRSSSVRGRRRNGKQRTVDSQPSSSSQNGDNSKAIVWKQVGNDESSGDGFSGGNVAEPWKRFNTIPADRNANTFSGELYYNVPLENRWSIVPYEGELVGKQSLEISFSEDRDLKVVEEPHQTCISGLLLMEEGEKGEVQEEEMEGIKAVVGEGSGETGTSRLEEEGVQFVGQQQGLDLASARYPLSVIAEMRGSELTEMEGVLPKEKTSSGDLRGLTTVHDLAMSNINPSASVRDVLSSDDWQSYSNGNRLARGVKIYDLISRHCPNLHTLPVGAADQPLCKGKGFSMSYAWKVMCKSGNQPTWTNWVWLKGLAPRISFLMWLWVKGRLRTAEFWYRIGVIGSPLCKGCLRSDETLDHALFLCVKVQKVWRIVGRYCEFTGWPTTSEDFLTFMDLLREARGGKRIIKICLTTIYHIWIERCKVANEGSSLSLWSLAIKIKAALDLLYN
ncbi:hypothetical protein MLD38_036637 [Melastoma candidum]|uniref:Uncharacterized protein n=1 Tax=Melastoma candidum TaxID=119954 RepID=A0ACB9LKQ6_9MYRT|nr:hypothetical protein MLD38_036637 [Melastoma candidum]